MRAPEAAAKAIAEASPFMAARLKDHRHAMHDASARALKDDAPWSENHAEFLKAALDYAGDQTVWMTAYTAAVRNGAADPAALADTHVGQAPAPELEALARRLPEFIAHFPKTGTEPASPSAQNLHWLSMLSPALSAARLPVTARLKPWLPAAPHGPLPPLPTLPVGVNSHAVPDAKASHDQASLANALTGISNLVGQMPEARSTAHASTNSDRGHEMVEGIRSVSQLPLTEAELFQNDTNDTVHSETRQAGGAYKDVRGLSGYEAHHMPADSVSPLSTGDGPSIAMTIGDHQLTASWGNSYKARAYRKAQANLISEGDFQAAQQMDIDDIIRKFGTKYDEAIQQMLNYSQSQGY